MARFYVTAQGNRGECSRMGSAVSGILAHPRGWNVGVRVHGHAEDDADVFDIWATGGSSGYASSRYLGEVRLNSKGEPQFRPAKRPAGPRSKHCPHGGD